MSYTVEQKIKGNVYLYKVESYWDKEKKQSRQKRTYIGPKDKEKKQNVRSIKSEIVHKNFGNIFLLNQIAETIGLRKVCADSFPLHHKELLALAYYQIVESSPLYLFPYWLEETHLPHVARMDSSAISKFCQEVGRLQQQRVHFQEQWVARLQPVQALYYDITSISSYSSNVEFVEWGYNRDKEALPQVNMGVVFCSRSSLPILYNLYPGSIVDVKTLANCVKLLQTLGLKEFMFILDRGFFSTDNVRELAGNEHRITFIQPLPFSLRRVKELVRTHRKDLRDIHSNFSFNDEILSHQRSSIELGGNTYTAHLFLNEKTELDQRQLLMRKLIEIEGKIIRSRTFASQKEAIEFKSNSIERAYQDCFRFNRSTGRLVMDSTYVKARIARLGFFILMTNDERITREGILANYRDKDQVEKVFDLLKNEMDGGRLRVHDQFNADARLFINFIALIIQSELIRRMRKGGLFKRYTARELLAELRKIKYSVINGQTIISEVSKKQRLIFETLDVDEIHRY